MNAMTVKATVLELVKKLPEDVSYETIMSELVLRKKVEEGLRQADAGETLTPEQGGIQPLTVLHGARQFPTDLLEQ